MPCYFSQSDTQLRPQESGGRRQLEVEDARDGLVGRGVDGPRARRPCRLRLWGGRRRGRRGHLYQGRGVLRRLRAAMALTWSWVCSGPRGRYDPLLRLLTVVVIRELPLYHYRRPQPHSGARRARTGQGHTWGWVPRHGTSTAADLGGTCSPSPCSHSVHVVFSTVLHRPHAARPRGPWHSPHMRTVTLIPLSA